MVDYTNATGYVVDEKGRRQFQDRDKANGIDGTSLIADDRNQDRNALVDLVKAAGITPSSADETQVTQAVQFFGKRAASGAVMGTPGVLADGDVAGKLLYYAANQNAPVFVYGTTTVALVTTTALGTVLQGFLPLEGGNVTGAMDWGSKTAAATLTHRYWSAGPPAEGDATPDATLTIAGGTPGTANKGTMALSTGTLDLSETGEVLAPDATEFDGKQVVNAGSAEGRYVKSVPDANTTNKRITDIWKDADGRTVTGDGSGSNVLASLSDLPTQLNGVDSSGRGYGYQKFNDGTMIIFGYAYYSASSAGTGTVVTLPFSFPGKFIGLVCTDYGANNNAVAAYPESQSSFRCWAGAPTIKYLNTIFYYSARGTWK